LITSSINLLLHERAQLTHKKEIAATSIADADVPPPTVELQYLPHVVPKTVKGAWDNDGYYLLHPDVFDAGQNSRSHWLKYGVEEGRRVAVKGDDGLIYSGILAPGSGLKGPLHIIEIANVELLSLPVFVNDNLSTMLKVRFNQLYSTLTILSLHFLVFIFHFIVHGPALSMFLQLLLLDSSLVLFFLLLLCNLQVALIAS
jgi:hypothetical protein